MSTDITLKYITAALKDAFDDVSVEEPEAFNFYNKFIVTFPTLDDLNRAGELLLGTPKELIVADVKMTRDKATKRLLIRASKSSAQTILNMLEHAKSVTSGPS